MARLRFIAQTPLVALSAATTRTIVQVTAPANHRVVVSDWGVSFDGASPTATPVQCELVFQSTAGTMTGLTPAKCEPSLPETIQSTAQHSATAEPTTTSVVAVMVVHPQSGYDKVFPEFRDRVISGGGRIGIRCTAPAGVNVRGFLECEE